MKRHLLLFINLACLSIAVVHGFAVGAEQARPQYPDHMMIWGPDNIPTPRSQIDPGISRSWDQLPDTTKTFLL